MAGLFDVGLGLARMWACVWLWTASPFASRIGVASLDELWQLLIRAAVLWYAAFAVWILLL